MGRDRVARALIPAAGRGTRFLPFTKTLPKEMLPLVSTPALEYVVDEAARNKLDDVLLVLSAGKQTIADYFAPNPELEQALVAKGDDAGLADIRRAPTLASTQYVEQPEPLGLGDAVAQGELFADGEPFAVLLPDDLIDDRDDLLGRMLDVYDEHGGIVLGLMDVPRAEISRYGCAVPVIGADLSCEVVELSDLIEKPSAAEAPSTLAIIGRYLLPPQIFEALRGITPGAGGEIQLTDAMRRLAHDAMPVHGVVFTGRRYDTGDRLGYLQAVVQLAARHPVIGTDFTAWLRDYVERGIESAEEGWTR
ncbi:MAG: UTP--glucose-1-phosphate uridylyltransferase [Actinomycetota bacterium]